MSICLYFQRSCLPHCLVVIPCSNVYLSVFPEIMSPPLSCSNSMFECLFVCISRDHVFHIVLWSFHVRMSICLLFPEIMSSTSSCNHSMFECPQRSCIPPLSCSHSMFEYPFVCISRDHVFHIVLWSFHVRMYICLYFQRSCLPHRLVIIPCSNVHRDHVFPHCLVVIPCSNVHLSVFLEIMSSLLSCSHSMFEYPFVCISRVHVFHVVL